MSFSVNPISNAHTHSSAIPAHPISAQPQLPLPTAAPLSAVLLVPISNTSVIMRYGADSEYLSIHRVPPPGTSSQSRFSIIDEL